MKSKPSSATVAKFLESAVGKPEYKDDMLKLGGFLGSMARWQTDSGAVDREKLVNQFKSLPEFLRKALSDDVSKFKTLWRGDDAGEGRDNNEDSIDSVKAFSDSPFAATFFGPAIYKADDAESVGGIINTDKIVDVITSDFAEKFNEEYGDEMEIDEIGNDEGERIVYDIAWKKGVGSDEWAKETQPKRYAEARAYAEKKDPESFEKQKGTIYDSEGRMRFVGEDGENMMPGEGKNGMQVYDPVTKIRIRPPVELILKDKMPQIFGEMTAAEKELFKQTDKRG